MHTASDSTRPSTNKSCRATKLGEVINKRLFITSSNFVARQDFALHKSRRDGWEDSIMLYARRASQDLTYKYPVNIWSGTVPVQTVPVQFGSVRNCVRPYLSRNGTDPPVHITN